MDSYFNILEVFNEASIILIVYSLQGFTSASLIEPALQWSLGYLTIGLISLVCLVNLIIMIVITPRKVIRFLKKRKIRKALEAREKRRAKQRAAQAQESMKKLNVISEESSCSASPVELKDLKFKLDLDRTG